MDESQSSPAGTSEKEDPVETPITDDASSETAGDKGSLQDADPYFYTKQDQFTSEIYKVEICNLPRFGFKELKKRLATLKVNPVKIKAINRNKFAFVTFRNEAEREDAIKKVEGHVWKGCKLSAKKAYAVADPLWKKRKLEQDTDTNTCEKKLKVDDNADIPSDIRLKNAVTPLWNVPYEEQLKMKFSEVEQVLKNFANQIHKQNQQMRKWLQSQRQKYSGHCCEVLPIKPSPVTTGYRNKCEFTIGIDEHGQDNTVGFRYGQYKSGNSCVGDADPLTNIPDSMKKVAKCFESYCRSGLYGAFNPERQDGHWKTLTVRTCQGQGIMAMLDFHPRTLPKDAIDTEKERLRQYFENGGGKESGVTSVYFHLLLDRVNDSSSFSQIFEHIWGDKTIEETLLGMKFKVSPDAFFQVNTLAAEMLYSQIGDWCDVSPSTTVLDICCGTGTIGLTLAKRVSKVIGIDLCEQAIEDAKENAKLNGVNNVTYHCCKVEDIISNTLKSLRSRDLVAVVDPPRAGLHQRVIRALRNCPLLSRIVYVSCNPKGAMNNFIDLVRQPSRHNKGEPYRPVRAIPVDMFPQTKHCELVILFERDLPETSDCSQPDQGQITEDVEDEEDDKEDDKEDENGQCNSKEQNDADQNE